jgi:hypothetical protein
MKAQSVYPNVMFCFLIIVILVILITLLYIFHYNYKILNTQKIESNKKNNIETFESRMTDESEPVESNIDKNSKIAFCFLTMGDIHQLNVWKDFFKGHENEYNIYIHPKFANKVSNSFKKYIIKKRLDTKWGDISLVNATIELFRAAYKDPTNKFFVLISDSCIPLYNFDFIYNYILSTNSNICPIMYFEPPKLKYRYTALKDINFIPYKKFQKTSQWCIMKRDAVEFLIDQDNNYTDLYSNMFAPDEHYFINMFDKFHIKYINKSIITNFQS